MQTSTFQIIFLGICATLILVGIGVFASVGGFLGGKSIGHVVLWGTVDTATMAGTIGTLRDQDKTFDNLTYIEKDPATYDTDLVNAMANGTAPDLFMLRGDELLTFSDKILTIPYANFSQSTFQSSFIDEGQLFLTGNGSLALPFAVDPLVMYWNRDLFAGAGVAQPPVYWNDFLSLSPKITSLDAGANVKKSAVALGEWRNISHAKEILSTLFMQAGDGIVGRDTNGNPAVLLGTNQSGSQENPAASALRFYTEFANPTKTSYAWNRALPNSSLAFASGDLAAYFGYASEYTGLLERNPNLRFSASVVPQIEGNATRITYGNITGLAIPRTSRNAGGALTIAEKLTSREASVLFVKATGMPSVRRDVQADTESSSAAEVFAASALIARAWLDPSARDTDAVFQNMIESVVSGKSQSIDAVPYAAQEMSRLLPKQ